MNKANPSKLKEFAERVLFGSTLEDKLSPPQFDIAANDEFTCFSSQFVTPNLPGRPEGLQLSSTSTKRQPSHFPNRSKLSDDRARGLVLHFFANHELLALELMALTILKFSDAPNGFIRGIVQTMMDEQRHMHQYMKRIGELGTQFGEAPLNGFFWQTLKDIQSPQEYTAAMSLTFEQANLDFSLQFEQNFRLLGDNVTADILREVRLDEIGHVKHGAIWLERWRDPAKNLWDEYVSHLRFPMTPARAKGPVFDRDGRLNAGLSDEFINKLEVYSHSRGRPPKIFWFNPICEQEVGVQSDQRPPPRAITEITGDLSVLMMNLGHRDDVVLVHQQPSVPWLATMKHAGFEIPEFVVGGKNPLGAVTAPHIGGIFPWGWSPSAEKKLSGLQEKSVSGIAREPMSCWKTDANGQNIFSKVHAVRLRDQRDLMGHICSSISEILEALRETLCTVSAISSSSDKYPMAVIKAPIGSSGHNAVHVDLRVEILPRTLAWCEKILSEQRYVVIEPWVDRIADLSCQFEILPTGETKIFGFTRFLVSPRGTYKGHVFGKFLGDLPQEIHVKWHNLDDGWARRFESAAMRCSQFLFGMGYHGPAGIDGFLYRNSLDQIEFQSLGEINPRYTMGRVALEISSHLIAKQPGVWIHISKSEMKEAGFENFQGMAEHIELIAPLKIRRHPSGGELIESGALCTNDPRAAKQILTVLWANVTPNQVQQMLKKC